LFSNWFTSALRVAGLAITVPIRLRASHGVPRDHGLLYRDRRSAIGSYSPPRFAWSARDHGLLYRDRRSAIGSCSSPRSVWSVSRSWPPVPRSALGHWFLFISALRMERLAFMALVPRSALGLAEFVHSGSQGSIVI
jgi:hypothetical protein